MKKTLLLTLALMASGCGPLPPDGPYETYYYFQRQLKLKGTYKAGELDGPYESYYENGQLEEKGTYVLGGVDPQGNTYTYSRHSPDVYIRGARDGPYVYYYENGQLQSKGVLNMGGPCGEWIEYGETVTYDPCPPGLEDGN